jgi:hypothetical protein
MANPVIKTIKENEWRLMATSVTAGNIWLLDESQNALFTYRMTGGIAPTTADEGVRFQGQGMIISNDAPIDVYIMALNDNGKVRVDV